MNRALEEWLAQEPVSHRVTALRHASIHQRPGLWVDDVDPPSSVVWLREGDPGGWEAFAHGAPGPALDWIERTCRISLVSEVALLAPDRWEDEVRRRKGRLEIGMIETFSSFESIKLTRFSKQVRVLTSANAQEFEAMAPSWALRSWGDFSALIDRGLAVGLSGFAGLVAVAWTYESDREHDKLGVANAPPVSSARARSAGGGGFDRADCQGSSEGSDLGDDHRERRVAGAGGSAGVCRPDNRAFVPLDPGIEA